MDFFIFDGNTVPNPEDLAMLQALYSRSPDTVINHLDKVGEAGSGKFMERYYVGYNHASIGDCGNVAIFVEGVTHLVAKAIQDWPLYNGQECSTRYLDFSNMPPHNPFPEDPKYDVRTLTQELLGHLKNVSACVDEPLDAIALESVFNKVTEDPVGMGLAIKETWMTFYTEAVEKVTEELYKSTPKESSQTTTQYENAIKARAFDICRGLLPISSTTSLSVYMSLRQCRELFDQLAVSHPLHEVRTVAKRILSGLRSKYPHSLSATDGCKSEDIIDMPVIMSTKERDRTVRHKKWLEDVAELRYKPKFMAVDKTFSDLQLLSVTSPILSAGPASAASALHDRLVPKKRPPFAPVPRALGLLAQACMAITIDYGSYRDLQRHRDCWQEMPIVGANGLVYNDWYIEMYRELIGNKFVAQLNAMVHIVENCAMKLDNKFGEGHGQYVYPLATNVKYIMMANLAQLTYIGELRSGASVHPTLRPIAQAMCGIVSNMLGSDFVHPDMSEDQLNLKRGKQTIIEKD